MGCRARILTRQSVAANVAHRERQEAALIGDAHHEQVGRYRIVEQPFGDRLAIDRHAVRAASHTVDRLAEILDLRIALLRIEDHQPGRHFARRYDGERTLGVAAVEVLLIRAAEEVEDEVQVGRAGGRLGPPVNFTET